MEDRQSAEVVHSTVDLALEDYARELAFLTDLAEVIPTELDYSASNVKSEAHSAEQSMRLVDVLKSHEHIMISSGNVLPLPAYGEVCDIDVQGHESIRQRARRVPLKHLGKLYELLKALLKSRLIGFSNSPWASPIVIVLKNNGVDIRLCIDYKMVDGVTLLMKYVMPLVDDLHTELESYLWFCSLDAASGFWAVMMTRRSRWILAFVCALGHFEWLRMPFGLKNAPMIYQRLIDNALWRYVQPKGGWAAFAERIRRAEAESEAQRKTHSVEFRPAEKEVLALLQLIEVCHTLLAGKTINIYTPFSTLEWFFYSKSLYGRAVSLAVLLSPYHLKVKRVREQDVVFAQLLQASITLAVRLDELLAHVAPPSKSSATVRMDPELLYARVPAVFKGHVLSFNGSAKTEQHGGYGSRSWILWWLPEWHIEIAASTHLQSVVGLT